MVIDIREQVITIRFQGKGFMPQEQLKRAAAAAAIDYIQPKIRQETIIGIGTGSTANFFIDSLAKIKELFTGTVASSSATAERLSAHGIPVYDLNKVENLSIYVDGADESDPQMALIKGGGAALTREKIVAACALEFVCIVDESKMVDILGKFPLPLEVIPMARSYVTRELFKLGGNPVHRKDIMTDNGNIIIDVNGLTIHDPVALEQKINQLAGVVTNGLFAQRRADTLVLSKKSGVEILSKFGS